MSGVTYRAAFATASRVISGGRNMKKLFALLLVGVFAMGICLTGCKGDEKPEDAASAAAAAAKKAADDAAAAAKKATE
jgi:hypothetical protein